MLGIIIVNYRNEDKTIEYVKEELIKIQTQNIIVVVNNSATAESNDKLKTSLSAELVHDIRKIEDENKRCFIVSHSDNLGFAKGNNLGAEFLLNHCTIRYFLFSNNDIRFIDTNAVEALIEKADTLPNVGVIGPNIIGVDGRKQSPDPYYSFWARYFWMYWLTPFMPKSVKNKLFKLNYTQQAQEGIHYRVMGSFFLVKAVDFVACGMMDPNTFLFSEEMILAERMKAIKRDIYFYPAVTILHEHNQTISKFIVDKKKFMLRFESECYYYRTYRNVSLLSTYIGKLSFQFYLSLGEFERKKK
jgi:GT2 family glycosyltransferase